MVQQLVDAENITSCLPGQLDRRASEDHGFKPEVRSDPENKEVCLYLVNGFQNAFETWRSENSMWKSFVLERLQDSRIALSPIVTKRNLGSLVTSRHKPTCRYQRFTSPQELRLASPIQLKR
jgi:hypothetical protein